jgi:hypothetical protein
MNLYVESSAVLSWILGEPDGERACQLIDEAELVVTSTVTALEVERCLVRYACSHVATESDLMRSRAIFRSALSGWYTMELTEAVRNRATERFPVEPVRSLDAVHLATALQFTGIAHPLHVLSFDRRILDNLGPLGLSAAR